MNKKVTFPTILTLTRLIIAPLVLPILLKGLIPFHIPILSIGLAVLFFLFSLTDFLDGYLARRYQLVTRLGSILDPIADKFLLYSVLIALVALGNVYYYWAILFIGREFFVMSLRLVAASLGFTVAVASLGKIKTALQTVYIIVVLYNTRSVCIPLSWEVAEQILLFLALFLSVWSAYRYYVVFMTNYYALQDT